MVPAADKAVLLRHEPQEPARAVGAGAKAEELGAVEESVAGAAEEQGATDGAFAGDRPRFPPQRVAEQVPERVQGHGHAAGVCGGEPAF
jgi:hypothetical protein